MPANLVFEDLPESHRESPMSPSTPATCNHDRGRGTTVCLRCRHEQAQASARRRQRFLMQFLGLASVAAVLAIAGVSAASTLRGRGTSETTSGGTVISDAGATKTKMVTRPVAPKVAPVVQQSAAVTPPPETATPAPAPASAPTSPLPRGGFVLVEGRTQ